jgi:hypothetical protein
MSSQYIYNTSSFIRGANQSLKNVTFKKTHIIPLTLEGQPVCLSFEILVPVNLTVIINICQVGATAEIAQELQLGPGTHPFTFNVNKYEAGCYFLNIKATKGIGISTIVLNSH